MSYYVGNLHNQYNTNEVFRTGGPKNGPGAIQLFNEGGGLRVIAFLPFSANYDLPAGAFLCRILINERSVVEDVPVLDMSFGNTEHQWQIKYDLSNDDLKSLIQNDGLLINDVEIKFYLNTDGLKNTSIAEYDTANAFDVFKKAVELAGLLTSSERFLYVTAIRHEFTDAAPFVFYLPTEVSSFPDGLGNTGVAVRVEIKPTQPKSGFFFDSLYEVATAPLNFKQYDHYSPWERTDFDTSVYYQDPKFGISYTNATHKTSAELVYGGTAGVIKADKGFAVDQLPSTRYASGTVYLDANGSPGVYFLDPTQGSIGISTTLKAGRTTVPLSLSTFFSTTRDVASELLASAVTDLTVDALNAV